MGTEYNPILVYDADIVSFTVATAAITLGQVVALDASADMTVLIGTAALKAMAIGVAESCRSTSSLVGSSTALTAAVGEKVSVRLKGIVNVTCSGTVTTGEWVDAADAGLVATTAAQGTSNLGIALSTATDDVVKIFLRGN